MLNISNLLFKDYEMYKDNLIENLYNDFSIRHEKTIILVEGEELEIQINHLLTNLILLRPYFEFNERITKEDFIDCSNFTSAVFNKRMEFLKEKFYTKERRLELSFSLSTIIEDMNYITLLYNKMFGCTVDVKSIAKLASRNEEFNDLIHTEIDVNNQSFDEIEKLINDRNKRAMDLVLEDGNEICFTDFIRCGEGLNAKQLKQYWINVGPKPSLSGKVYPIAVNSNFLTGLKLPSDYYIDATGGRKSNIINKDEVKDSGYLARKLSLATINTLLDSSVEDCGTTNLVEIDLSKLITKEDIDQNPDKKDEILRKQNKDTLTRLNGRHIIVDGREEIIDKNNIEHLFFKKIKLYSPITCACKTGICKKCYGHLSEINEDIHNGKLAVDILSSQLTQLLLSSKHLLETKSAVIKWDSNFLKIFKLNSNEISLLKPVKSAKIIFDQSELNLEDYIYNNRNQNNVFVEKLKIQLTKSTGEVKTRVISLPTKLFLSAELIDYIVDNLLNNDEEVITLNLANFDTTDRLFYFLVDNNELSSYLYKLQDLIELKDHLGCKTYEEMMETVCIIIQKSSIRIDLVHIECVFRELVKDKETNFRPDFSKEVKPEDYVILTLDNSILKNPCVTVGLAFERIADQLVDPHTYKKDAYCYLNQIFQ